jgi:F-type H+-transporting ATPase subunit b
MDINLTLLGEMLTFAILIWVTLKYIWPPLSRAMHERQKQIADGLAAAERGERTMELAKKTIKNQLQKSKIEAAEIIKQAEKRVANMLEEARLKADAQGAKMLELTREEMAAEMEKARVELEKEIVNLVFLVSEKVLEQNLTSTMDSCLVDRCILELKDAK